MPITTLDRTRAERGWRGAAARRLALLPILALLGALLLPLGSVALGASVTMEARGLVGGRYESGGWLAIAVSLGNDGAPVTGAVVVDGADGSVRRPLDLPAGSRKQVELYVRPVGVARQVKVRFEDDAGAALANATVDVRSFDTVTASVAIVGDGAGVLRSQVVGRGQGGGDPVTLAVSDMPQRPEPLDGLAAIVWAADSTTLTPDQSRAIERWIASGGQLTVVGGPDWQARTAAFAGLLPMTDLAAVDGVSTVALAELAGIAEELPAATVASGPLRDTALGLATTDDEAAIPLLGTMSFGAGRVTYLAVDVAGEAFRSAATAPLLWARVLPAQAAGGGAFVDPGMDAEGIMSQALSAIPSLEVPPAELLLAVLATYILLIGPISYIVLRRLDRRELAWITAPVLVVLFTAGSYGVGASMKGTSVVVNEIAVVRTAVDGSAASVQSFAGIFSPSRDAYDVSVAGDALIATLRSFDQDPNARRGYVVEQGEPARLRGLQVTTFGLQAIRADTVIDYEPGLAVTWHSGDGEITGEVTNHAAVAMTDVAIVTTSGGRMIGDLDPGESREFTLRFSMPQGSPSDAVYGFGGFDNATERQREITARRQVIDALVGYGQFGMQPMGGAGLDRGPFILGWRDDAPPTSVTLDGTEVQQYSQTLEVISGRPSLGPGHVELPPLQLSATLLATDGDASANDGASAFIGNGSGKFAITLPLEAFGMEVSGVTIVAGSDPSMLVVEGGAFPGMFPLGLKLEVQEVATGEWRELGDLAQATRYKVDDPASIIDGGGRITARVVGDAIDPSFGQMPVWVSAAVEGDI
jgi:hypothetical protein